MGLSIQDEFIRGNRIRALVTPALLAEARAHPPRGGQSAALVEVLDFLRRNPDPELPRYAVLRTPDGFAVVRRATVRGAPPAPDGADRHATRREAEHAVLLRRLRDYGLLP
ncbi:hypothetical protein GCM10009555_094240 [Acrocarpospora macrocephala]|uniref:N,N-dimethylformamidase alpha subunit domain-containing protein n=1 Tax=Acrocarpospora macrocephala TaxID=150177 RepID=A0A5M3WU65_9ACTN|nr:hypothetical protein [Acrocarpospora macrocephala]GES11559.1 hypothetical protein Amac_051560 [Acrocarpospora macrocephala]